MQLRKPQREINLDTDSPEFMESDRFVHLNDTEGISEDTLQALESALGTLNDKQRTCIDLFYMQQKSYEEISTITGLDIKEVKSHLQNGKRNLKIKMGDRGNLLGILILLWIHNIA
jgi:RNA polymerase sigma-70 factor (ECF subfamily)